MSDIITKYVDVDEVELPSINILNVDLSNHENTVELIGTYGGDITHAMSAWTSTERELTEDKLGRIDALLKFLAENGHHTPFEKSSIHFLLTMDIASHIHLIKHRIGVAVNAESARYKELTEDKFMIPVDFPIEEKQFLYEFMMDTYGKYHGCLERLIASGMSRKRAKESARFYLPYANQITCDVMFNFRSFWHFVQLRYSSHAQLEIRDITRKMLECVLATGEFDETLKAFGLTVDNEGTLQLRHPFD